MDGLTMSVAGAAMGAQQASLMNAANVMVMGKAMDTQKIAMDNLLSAMPTPARAPSFGHTLDVLA